MNVISLGLLSIGVHTLSVSTKTEPNGCDQNITTSCMDAYLMEFVREIIGFIRELQKDQTEPEKVQIEDRDGKLRTQHRNESYATQQTTPAPNASAQRPFFSGDGTEVICQSGVQVNNYIIYK